MLKFNFEEESILKHIRHSAQANFDANQSPEDDGSDSAMSLESSSSQSSSFLYHFRKLDTDKTLLRMKAVQELSQAIFCNPEYDLVYPTIHCAYTKEAYQAQQDEYAEGDVDSVMSYNDQLRRSFEAFCLYQQNLSIHQLDYLKRELDNNPDNKYLKAFQSASYGFAFKDEIYPSSNAVWKAVQMYADFRELSSLLLKFAQSQGIDIFRLDAYNKNPWIRAKEFRNGELQAFLTPFYMEKLRRDSEQHVFGQNCAQQARFKR